MKTIQLTEIILLFLLITEYSIGQTDFRQGYIIDNEGDSIHGWIDYRGDVRNARVCIFKRQPDSVPTEFHPFDIRAYRFNDSKFYVSKSFNLDGRTVDVFAEYLINGIVDLYYFRNEYEDFEHYFIVKKDGHVFHLTSEKHLITKHDVQYLVDDNLYKGLLNLAFSDCPDIFPQVEQTSLDHHSLIKVTRNYHDFVCSDEDCIVYEKELPPFQMRIAPILCLNISLLKFSGDMYYSFLDFKRSIYPAIGSLLNFSLPRINEKLSFQIDPAFGISSMHGTQHIVLQNVPQTNTVVIKTHFMSGSGILKYTYPRGRVRLSCGLGGSCFLAIKSESEEVLERILPEGPIRMVNQGHPVKPCNLGGIIQAGINCHINDSNILFCYTSYEIISGVNDGARLKMGTLNFTFGIYL